MSNISCAAVITRAAPWYWFWYEIMLIDSSSTLTPETAAKTVPDQRYYARRLDRPGIFTMKAEDILKLQKPAADYKAEPATQPATAAAGGG